MLFTNLLADYLYHFGNMIMVSAGLHFLCASERLVSGTDGAAMERRFLAEKEPAARPLSSIPATSDNCQKNYLMEF